MKRSGLKDDLVFHSDRGYQYSSKGYQQLLEENGITGSMSRPGCPYDNACVESFFASLKKEKIYRRRYGTMEEVKKDIFWYIEMFYNRKRRPSRQVLNYCQSTKRIVLPAFRGRYENRGFSCLFEKRVPRWRLLDDL